MAGRAGPEPGGRGGWGRGGGRLGERPHFVTAQEEQARGYGLGGAVGPGGSQAQRPLSHMAAGGGFAGDFGAAQYGGQPGGVGKTMPSLGASYGGMVPSSQGQILASSQLGGMGSTGQGQPAGFAGEEVHKRAPHALARSHA